MSAKHFRWFVMARGRLPPFVADSLTLDAAAPRPGTLGTGDYLSGWRRRQ